ncbi:tRNA (adenosine(37)-N6)-threonylcarbamoyltransferase complex dimerization subunit type 1 TsaB [Roseomonas sp. OT10]|uniref:tRNA (adenosine(37)-N6)-threonylcarbamoyltransferase complex dimerization subunit type 1 TsaB n=1 Tax=Roseomonas cutis TaxID=2897332 RepID=UPI001E419CAF|nr:tRNA (adenosine(37)-N6)-threonylcarbamoyltransferase complex dimerization subunit type 1 TsaB [Roseomonas sp. OT10]UFN46967.1 tRNA (adenosine(37)-N6)-threonylcarbamoyltransferase complex dimerization subunit type 1 TsaB [Roseomonas sp. OT10]
MRLLALDGALARCSAAVWEDGAVLAQAARDGAFGHAATLPALAREVLAEAPGAPEAVAVTLGPGGFTGLRAALALARGLALGWGVPCLGVTVGEALAATLADAPERVWCAVDTKRGRIALERLGEAIPPAVFAEADLPAPPGPVTLVGDAAPQAAARLLARGFVARLADPRRPDAAQVAAVAAARRAAGLPDRPAEPMYLEPPAVRLPAGG